MTQLKTNYETKVTELTKWATIEALFKTSGHYVHIFSEKEGMMEYVYQYDNLQKQLQLLQYVEDN